ncbi:gdp-fucose protein o-fucosyltransferase 2 [Holotrichia oblita]|uniref:Gdp-fucose protein o-fucosyltransferase 2 n=1 Tax=Holotrichia oblita TaxID=644536 RepID=A0ACB9TKH7_HOLOL|nr:gdp-fucose protein o-fucosyltransferase 2 [Holotrichia oblita]
MYSSKKQRPVFVYSVTIYDKLIKFPCFSYIFYDINPPEGFNLRRDVYMRYAIWLHKLQTNKNDSNLKKFKLVLPPWSHLYHWKYSEIPEHIPWALYFDIESLKRFAPVIEMYQFFDDYDVTYKKIEIDDVYILQHYQDMFETGKFEEKMSIEDCNEPIRVNYFYYNNITSNNVRCLSFHGYTSQLTSVLKNSTARSFLFDHAEVALHDMFGDKLYWKCRRSMRFNKELHEIAKKFREQELDANDKNDMTILPDDWRKEIPRRNAIGGSYLGIHLRRADFVRSRSKEIPTIENAFKQIKNKLEELKLDKVFVATDAPINEINEMRSLLEPKYALVTYKSEDWVKEKYKDGGIAIIEQIICSYARYFIGTYESTYSFRIQEEREILGFPAESTFNRLCYDGTESCSKPSIWKIVY